jgi:hypothetical protein
MSHFDQDAHRDGVKGVTIDAHRGGGGKRGKVRKISHKNAIKHEKGGKREPPPYIF